MRAAPGATPPQHPTQHPSATPRQLLSLALLRADVASNLPGGPLVQRFGAKKVGLVGIAGTAAIFALFSAVGVAGRRASTLLQALMLVCGLLQGPLSPVLMQTNQRWIPSATAADRVERTWSIRLQSLMHSFAPALSVAITPRLASRFDWKGVCQIYAVGTLAYAALWSVPYPCPPLCLDRSRTLLGSALVCGAGPSSSPTHLHRRRPRTRTTRLGRRKRRSRRRRSSGVSSGCPTPSR